MCMLHYFKHQSFIIYYMQRFVSARKTDNGWGLFSVLSSSPVQSDKSFALNATCLVKTNYKEGLVKKRYNYG